MSAYPIIHKIKMLLLNLGGKQIVDLLPYVRQERLSIFFLPLYIFH